MSNEKGRLITVEGRHIFIGDGESIDSAIKRAYGLDKENAEDRKERQINYNKKEAEERNNEKKSSVFSSKALSKAEQLKIILSMNPAEDEEHTWIREESDILTYPEAIKDTFGDDIDDVTPDFTAADIKKALKTGKITVYSSKPIVNGNFVTPSAMEAASYSGNQQIYKATLNLADVAWIDEGQGQLATKNNIDYTKMSSKGLI